MTRNIEPTTISPEMVGAYIEGNLSETEMRTFENLMKNDSELRNMVEDVRDLEVDMEASINEDYPDFMNTFELPLVADIDSLDSLEVVDYDIEVVPDYNLRQPINTNDDDMIDNKIDVLEDADHTFGTDNDADTLDSQTGIE